MSTLVRSALMLVLAATPLAFQGAVHVDRHGLRRLSDRPRRPSGGWSSPSPVQIETSSSPLRCPNTIDGVVSSTYHRRAGAEPGKIVGDVRTDTLYQWRGRGRYLLRFVATGSFKRVRTQRLGRRLVDAVRRRGWPNDGGPCAGSPAPRARSRRPRAYVESRARTSHGRSRSW
jgi:hypothetical protein